MSLYPEARANLSEADQRTLDLWEARAKAIGPEGSNVVTNIRNEARMVGNPPQAGSLALQVFLLQVLFLFVTHGAKQAFVEAAAAHLLEGSLLDSNPTIVHRFRPLDRFGESVAQANGEVAEWKRNPDEYVTNLLENWNTIGRQKVARTMLGARPPVFVTFRKPDGSLVTSRFHFGPDIMDALGVRLQTNQDVIHLQYPPPPDAPLKYPTAADGGWNQDFVVSTPTDPHGWTRPISNPATKGWPEAVHRNRRADLVVERPSRYPKI